MRCRNPYVQGVRAFPCGQCMPCRLNRRRVWTHRLLLEQLQHGDSAFVTLTYDDDHLPLGESLVPKDAQDWLKRFRKDIYPLKVRYYLVGEYGDESFRPHYHVALFGYPTCRFGVSRYSRSRLGCCDICDRVRDTWGRGYVSLGILEPNSAQYIAGYVTKKMTSGDDPRLGGRHPEFARMSLRPGLGYDALFELSSEILKLDLVDPQGDVPSALRHGSRLLPLGRYLRRKLRSMVLGNEAAPASTLAELEELVRPLFEAAGAATAGLKVQGARATLFKNLLIDSGQQAVASMEARSRIYKKRNSI